jgi:hypothetical protein
MAANQPTVSRSDLFVAFVIAIVSITTAGVAWRGSLVSSSGGDASRAGLINTLKKDAGASENVRKLYQEATFAQNYAAYVAELKVLNESSDPVAQVQAQQLRQFLLPALAQFSPLVSDPAYLKRDGSFNLDTRLADLNAENPDLAKLDPQVSFNRADQYAGEQRWLTVNIVVLVMALFWLTVAQIAHQRLRWATLSIGGVFYLLGLTWFVVVEGIFFILRGGL